MPSRRQELKRELIRVSGPSEGLLSEIIQLLGPQLAPKCRVLIWKNRNHPAGVQQFDYNRIAAANGTVSNGTNDIWNPRTSTVAPPWVIKNTDLAKLYSPPLTMFHALESVKAASEYTEESKFQAFFKTFSDYAFTRMNPTNDRLQAGIRSAGTQQLLVHANILGAFSSNTKILSALDVNSAGGQWHVNGQQESSYNVITLPSIDNLAHWSIGYGNESYPRRPSEILAVNGLFDVLTAAEKVKLTTLASIRALL